MIHVTEEAARELQILLEGEPPGRGLRLRVQKGGCAGFQYDLRIDSRQAEDAVVESTGGALLLDPETAAYVRGSTVSYDDSLNDSGFKIINPNAARSCGCGTSFEPAADPLETPAQISS